MKWQRSTLAGMLTVLVLGASSCVLSPLIDNPARYEALPFAPSGAGIHLDEFGRLAVFDELCGQRSDDEFRQIMQNAYFHDGIATNDGRLLLVDGSSLWQVQPIDETWQPVIESDFRMASQVGYESNLRALGMGTWFRRVVTAAGSLIAIAQYGSATATGSIDGKIHFYRDGLSGAREEVQLDRPVFSLQFAGYFLVAANGSGGIVVVDTRLSPARVVTTVTLPGRVVALGRAQKATNTTRIPFAACEYAGTIDLDADANIVAVPKLSSPVPGGVARSAALKDSTLMVAAGSQGLWWYVDAGKTWHLDETGPFSHSFRVGAYAADVAMVNDEVIVAAGNDGLWVAPRRTAVIRRRFRPYDPVAVFAAGAMAIGLGDFRYRGERALVGDNIFAYGSQPWGKEVLYAPEAAKPQAVAYTHPATDRIHIVAEFATGGTWDTVMADYLPDNEWSYVVAGSGTPFIDPATMITWHADGTIRWHPSNVTWEDVADFGSGNGVPDYIRLLGNTIVAGNRNLTLAWQKQSGAWEAIDSTVDDAGLYGQNLLVIGARVYDLARVGRATGCQFMDISLEERTVDTILYGVALSDDTSAGVPVWCSRKTDPWSAAYRPSSDAGSYVYRCSAPELHCVPVLRFRESGLVHLEAEGGQWLGWFDDRRLYASAVIRLSASGQELQRYQVPGRLVEGWRDGNRLYVWQAEGRLLWLPDDFAGDPTIIRESYR